MYSLAMALRETQEIKLSICTVYEGSALQKHEIEGVFYYLLPKNHTHTKYDSSLEAIWRRVTEDFDPDLIHIHGTEYAHGLACVNACSERKFVVSIQGLVGIYYHYYYGGIRLREILSHLTFHDLRYKSSIIHGKSDFKRRGEIEKSYVRKVEHIIGRTSWDYAHIKKMNPNVQYHFCNEVLRKSFYTSTKWSLTQKIDFSIFVSQAGYPIKGLHQVLKAFPIIKSIYPAAQLRIAGVDLTMGSSIREKLNSSGYGAYLRSLLDKLDIRASVTFVGPLGEDQMIREYQNAHVFVCPSSIENSPNSVGEAQIIGTPVIASFVGGLPDMVNDEETGLLYRFEDYIMLAYKVIRVFKDDQLAKHLSSNSQIVAERRHNNRQIKSRILEIYSEIVEA